MNTKEKLGAKILFDLFEKLNDEYNEINEI
jgi:hypothetical protein